MTVRICFAAVAGLASVAVADIPWEWNESQAVRSPAATATASLASFVSKSPVAEGTESALAAFDSRVRTVGDCAVAGFSTRPLGVMLIVR